MATSNRIAAVGFVQRVVRAVYPYGSEAVIRRGPLKGNRIVVGPAMGLTYVWDLDPGNWDWVRFIEPGQCVYDIGANFGQSTLRLAQAVGPTGRIIAFEPVAESFAKLCRHVELNGLSQVTPVEGAISSRTGPGTLNFHLHATGMGRLSELSKGTGEDRPVKLFALDDYESLGWPKPDLLKIDVEGGAPYIVEGAGRFLNSVRPLIYLETHSRQEVDTVALLRERYGYAAERMASKGAFLCRPPG